MSREAEYQFIPTDPENIIAWLTSAYEQIMGETVQPASRARLFIQWVACVIIQERVQTNYAGNQNIPSRAGGKNLDALAELFYTKERPAAKAATCTMRFTISEAQAFAVLIPGGSRITDASNTLIWATAEDVYVKAGETSADVKAVCQTVGKTGNGFVAGQINTIVDLFAYCASCENLTESDGGDDEATDEEFYELMRASMDAYSSAGARGAYEYWARKASTEIADVIAVSPEPCVVKLYILMKDGTLATDEVKAAVLAECSADERRPLCDLVSAEDAEKVPYRVNLTYYQYNPLGNGKTSAELAAEIRRKVDEYTAWQSGKLGRDINPARLVGMLMQTGVKRVEVTEPVFTALRDGGLPRSLPNVPQIAVLEGVTITDGGFEDE